MELLWSLSEAHRKSDCKHVSFGFQILDFILCKSNTNRLTNCAGRHIHIIIFSNINCWEITHSRHIHRKLIWSFSRIMKLKFPFSWIVSHGPGPGNIRLSTTVKVLGNTHFKGCNVIIMPRWLTFAQLENCLYVIKCNRFYKWPWKKKIFPQLKSTIFSPSRNQ